MSNTGRTDWFLFTIAAGMALFGSVMVYSASAMMALKETQDQTDLTYFYKQLGFTLAGIVVMVAVSRLDYHILENKYVVYGLLAATAILLLTVLGFPAINGAKRWIRIGGFSFQPSEIAKVTLPVFLAYFLTKRENKLGDLKRTVVPCLAILAACGARALQTVSNSFSICRIHIRLLFFRWSAKSWV